MSKTHLTHDSVAALVQHATCGALADERNRSLYARNLENMSVGDADPFRNGYSLERALAELTAPPSRVHKVAEAIGEIEGTGTHQVRRRRVVRNQFYGGALDPVKVARRQADAWSQVRRDYLSQTVITILCNYGINCCGKPDNLFWRGAAAAAFADALERNGHRVQIDVGNMICSPYDYDSDDRDTISQITTVKRPDMPCDISALTLVLGEIGFFRTVGILEIIASGVDRVYEGLGRSKSFPKEISEKYDVVFDADIYGLSDAKAAIKHYGAKFLKQ